MYKRTFFLFVLLIVSALGISAQDDRPASSCSCTQGNGGCSASQTCPDGHIAVCSCSASGCSSSCIAVAPRPVSEKEVVSAITRNDTKALSDILSRAYGRQISFSASENSPQLPKPPSVSSFPSDWTLLEFLDRNGTLTINGQPLSFWRSLRESLLNGGEFQICSERADAILNQIAFISGKSFSVAAGDSKAKIVDPIKGHGLSELLLNLSNAANIRIVNN